MVDPLCTQDLPLPSGEEVISVTGNPLATPHGLLEACGQFRSLLFGSQQQLRHSLRHVPLPLTHCSNCLRCTGSKALDFAELSYSKEQSTSLGRINGAVFSALCGHMPPFCCDVSWQSLELLETYARHDKSRKVVEAPWNPGSAPAYSYVGTSLRLLPGAPLDLVTDAWQKSLGYDSKPHLEMLEALKSLVGTTVSSHRLQLMSSAGPLQAAFVVASCEISDFSPAIAYQTEHHVCILGQLSLTFLDKRGEPVQTVALPTRQSVLATVPFCEKGQTPVISGKHCYVKRCFEERPNEIHVLKTSDREFECSLLSQDLAGNRRRLLLKLSEDKGRRHLLVRVAKKIPAEKGGDTLPLLPWLFGKVLALDPASTVEQSRAELKRLVSRALSLDFSCCRLDEAFVCDFLDEQDVEPKEEEDQPPEQSEQKLLFHASAEALLETTARMIARLLATSEGLCGADALKSTKTLNSASDAWRALVVDALKEALKKAVFGCRCKKNRRKSTNRTEESVFNFEATVRRCEDALSEGLPPSLSFEHVSSAAARRHYCKLHCSEELPPSFVFLHEKTLKWFQDFLSCPLCSHQTSPLDATEEHAGSWSCAQCGFQVSNDLENLELLCIRLSRRSVKKPTTCPSCAAQLSDSWACEACGKSPWEDGQKQRSFFALAVAERLASDKVSLRLLRAALTGHDPLAQRKKRPQACEMLSKSTEGSARGPFPRRGAAIPPELHENLLDCKAGKDSNPDARIFLLTGSRSQSKPSQEDLEAVVLHLRDRLAPLQIHDLELQGAQAVGRVEVLLKPVCFFWNRQVHEVLKLTRLAVTEVAWKLRKPELVTCCPVLRYVGDRALVTLLCSGRELVRPVMWRPFFHEEMQLLDVFFKQGPSHLQPLTLNLHECWRDLGSSGLTFELLIHAQIVTFCAEDRYMVFKPLPPPQRCLKEGEQFELDGLCFYEISAELESSVRTMQTTDAATWPAFHGVRVGMTSTGAIAAHAPEMLSAEKASSHTSSVRSLGFGPCKANMRNLIGSAPCDNAFSSTLTSIAVIRDYGSWMLEDSMPCSEASLRHDVLRSFSLQFPLPDHWEDVPCLSYKTALRDHVAHSSTGVFRRDISAYLDDSTGFVKAGSYVERGQALCYVPPRKEALRKEDRRCYLYVSPQDLWVLRAEAGGCASVVKVTTGSLEVKCQLKVHCQVLSMPTDGQKVLFPCQKLVKVLLPDRLSGGTGSINGLLSSRSIASRTAVQNLTHAAMVDLALASGHGPLRSRDVSSEAASSFREYLHSSQPMSMSSLLALKSRLPRASVSNEGPLTSWKTGRLVGRCLQYMMPLYLATQDDYNPSGSINGLGERGGSKPGFVLLDPIATALERSMGLEEHEEGTFEPQYACSLCGKLEVCGSCGCPEEPHLKKIRREVNLNPVFRQTAADLACANIDVHVSWKKPLPELDPGGAQPPCQDPEDLKWEAVPRKRRLDVSMLDLKRRRLSERGSERSERIEVRPLASGGCESLSFGAAPLDRILRQQLEFSMRNLGHGVVWESGDHTNGFTSVALAEEGLYKKALLQASEDFAQLGAALAAVSFSGELSRLRLEQIKELTPGVWLAAAPGGALHLQTTSFRAKELLLGLLDYGASATRSHRAYLVRDIGLELLPLENPGYSCWQTCNEQELRQKLQRELSYLALATTLAALPLKRDFFLDGEVVEAFFLLSPTGPHLSASDVYVEKEGRLSRLFHEDAVLGPNPRARGWLDAQQEKLPLSFIVHKARVDAYPRAWQELQMFSDELKRGLCDKQKLDAALTASVPPLVACDQRSVYKVYLRKGKRLPPSFVCNKGVFEGLQGTTGTALQEDLTRRSWLYCTNCGDCTRTTEAGTEGKSVSTVLKDIEDIEGISALDYSLRHSSRKEPVVPSVRVEKQDRWAFRCHCDEDLHPQILELLDSNLEEFPKRLKDIPRVSVLLESLDPPTQDQLQAEASFLAAFYEKRGGAPVQMWKKKACSALQLLADAARDLSEALRDRSVDYV